MTKSKVRKFLLLIFFATIFISIHKSVFAFPCCVEPIISSQLDPLFIDAVGSSDSVKKTSHYGFSGLRIKGAGSSDEDLPAPLQGKNIYNYIKIGMNVATVDETQKDSIGLTGVVFAGSLGAGATFASLSSAMTSVAANKGFIALYAGKNVTVAGTDFTEGYYYFYLIKTGGTWGWVTNDSAGAGYEHFPYGARNTNGVRVGYLSPDICKAGTADPKINPCFQIHFFKLLTASADKTWATYLYVYDNEMEQDVFTQNKTPVYTWP